MVGNFYKFNFIILSVFAQVNNAHLNIDINVRNPAIDYKFHEEVLDTQKCEEQISVLRSNPLLFWQFSDAGLRLPRGITAFNFRDMGNYHQCLGINHNTGEDLIQGKYCRIHVPLGQNWSLPWQYDSPLLSLIASNGANAIDIGTIPKARELNLRRAEIITLLGLKDEISKTSLGQDFELLSLDLAMCIPRVCSTEQAMNSLVFNTSSIGFTYTDIYCRLPHDKPWSTADTVATVIFSILALLTLLSTSYDLINTFWFKNDPKKVNPMHTSFSIYTNGRRLNTFSSDPGILRCIDGIRALAMAWVVVGHAFGSEIAVANFLDALNWLQSTSSVWISAGDYTVDTFFCLSGVVLVYTTADKITGVGLLKNLPYFYLNRVLRLMPMLALGVLLQASYFNRVFDGPGWTFVEAQTNYCRSTWWLTLLFVQNYINSEKMCLLHSWYVAVDFHCYLVSPLVLFWVLGRSRKSAWSALTAGLLAILTASTTYNFIMGFPSGVSVDEVYESNYTEYYYKSTLTRASPFFVGLIAGYVLHLYRGKKLGISWMTAALLWVISATVSTTVFFFPVINVDPEWDQPFVDNIMNSFMRPAWGAAISWMIVACVHGYGGPVNWFLSLDIWRLPARIGYAVFVLHFPMMFLINAALALEPIHFSVASLMFKFLAHLTLSFIIGYLATLIIDAPCSTLCKLLLEGNMKKPTQTKITKYVDNTPVKDTDNNGCERDGLDKEK